MAHKSFVPILVPESGDNAFRNTYRLPNVSTRRCRGLCRIAPEEMRASAWGEIAKATTHGVLCKLMREAKGRVGSHGNIQHGFDSTSNPMSFSWARMELVYTALFLRDD